MVICKVEGRSLNENYAIQNVEDNHYPAEDMQMGTVIARAGTVMRRPVAGPFWLGLLFGGVPCGIGFSRLSGRLYTPELMRYLLFLTPVVFLVTVLGAVANTTGNWISLTRRAFLAALAACVPLPIVVCTVLGWSDRRWGAFAPENSLVLVGLFSVWAVVVAIPGWLVASLVAAFGKRASSRRASPATKLAG